VEYVNEHEEHSVLRLRFLGWCSTLFAMVEHGPVERGPLHQVLGRRLRALRTAAGRLQEDVAAAARTWGFDWQRGTVAMIEGGRRRVTAEEFLALPQIARDAGLDGLRIDDLVIGGSSAVWVILNPFTALDTALPLDTAYQGGLVPTGADDQASDPPEAREIRRLWPRLLPEHRQSKAEVLRIALESHGDAETKAARTLGVSPVAVAMVAQRRWHQSLTALRDALAAGREGIGSIDPRKLQARRGHITRQLVGELRLWLTNLRPTRRTR
jgi:transcriptional regulator with XRE-family HTH domain